VEQAGHDQPGGRSGPPPAAEALGTSPIAGDALSVSPLLDEEDIGRQDFVRKEYALALKLKKNIVPVKHEDFVFPDKGRVPADVQPVMGMNAIPWISAYREASFDRLKNALM
jgi:hypothetical protein